MPISPWSARSFSSSKTCDTRPRSRTVMMWPFSVVAMPADSCPRCWSAYSAKYASRATSDSGAYTPKTPHSSRGPSRSSSATRVMRSGGALPPVRRVPTGDGVFVGLAQLLDRHRQRALDLERRAADGPDDARAGHDLDGLRRPGDHHAARALAEQRLGARVQPVHADADAALDAALRQRHGHAAL